MGKIIINQSKLFHLKTKNENLPRKKEFGLDHKNQIHQQTQNGF